MEADQTLLGFIDETGPRVSGWAVDLENPDNRCPLDLYIDGVFVTTVWTGNVRRPDIKEKFPHLAGEHYGFSVDIREWLKPIEQKLDVRFSRSGEIVSGGTFSAKATPFGIELINGNNGYIFFKGDSNNTLKQLSSPCTRPQAELDELCMALAATQAVCRNFGAAYGAMIVPDRAAAIPDEVGHSFELSPRRPVLRLIEHARSDYGFDIHYPLAHILTLPSAQRAPQFDTHLSTYAVHQAFLALAGRHFPERLRDHNSRIRWTEERYQGDLVVIGRLDASEPNLTPHFDATSVELFDTLRLYPQMHYSGSTRAYFNPSIATGVALIFGTSSSKMMLPFFANSFRVVAHVWNNVVDYKLISKFEPTHVFHLITEKTVGSLSIPCKEVTDADRLLAAKQAHFRQD